MSSDATSSDPSSRLDAGIPPLTTIDWGTNICLFCETREDLLRTTAAFFKAGVENRELCVWAVSDPITYGEAEIALTSAIPAYRHFLTAGAISISAEEHWSVRADESNLQRITGGWAAAARQAVRLGYKGVRISGNASWLETDHWSESSEYDREIDRAVAGKNIVVLCTHLLRAKRAVDIPTIVRAHHFTVYRRKHGWELADTPEFKQAQTALVDAETSGDAVSKEILKLPNLTSREKVVLSEIIQGHSSKQIGDKLAISPRTIDFHRANILSKMGARNAPHLVRILLWK